MIRSDNDGSAGAEDSLAEGGGDVTTVDRPAEFVSENPTPPDCQVIAKAAPILSTEIIAILVSKVLRRRLRRRSP